MIIYEDGVAREAVAEELDAIKNNQKKAIQEMKLSLEIAAAKEKARAAILEKLGLTAEELSTLIG